MDKQSLIQDNLSRSPRCGPRKVDPAWQERMVLQYAPLIRYIASRLALRLPAHISQEDLISSGIIGLIAISVGGLIPQLANSIGRIAVIFFVLFFLGLMLIFILLGRNGVRVAKLSVSAVRKICPPPS